jgi:tetratricopeptide (TPR) repeat protein
MSFLVALFRKILQPILLATIIALLAAPIAPATSEELGRDNALAALASPASERRKEGVLELGRVGLMGDTDALVQALHDDDAAVRAAAEYAMWQIWLRSGDPEVDRLLASGMRSMEDGRMGAAVDAFTHVIEKRPDFAEGWNKRATAYFLMGDYDQSLEDCDETLKRNPDHFGALSGCGMIYAARDDLAHALEYFERALRINPNLKGVERGLELVRQKLEKRGKRSI